ncbi:MAG: hypothetical protein HY848_12765 [Betaproteobacteria bacterium]|nr:hypothetical protein [Betaproteobacteria bacterium]
MPEVFKARGYCGRVMTADAFTGDGIQIDHSVNGGGQIRLIRGGEREQIRLNLENFRQELAPKVFDLMQLDDMPVEVGGAGESEQGKNGSARKQRE